MSFPGRGRTGRRGRRVGFGVFAGALFAWQALTLIGAAPALAAVSCTFSGGVVTITAPAPGDAVLVQQRSNTQIFFNGSTALCGPTVLTTNTTAINITGAADDQSVTIRMYDETGKTVSWGTIDWTINLASNTPAGDSLTVTNAGGDAALKLTMGASGIDLNNDANLDVALTGVENVSLIGGPKGDTILAGGSTVTGAAFATAVTITGNDGADTLTGGSGNDTITGDAGDDTIAGGLGDDTLNGGTHTTPLVACDITTGDTVDYSSSTTAVIVNLTAGTATGQGTDLLTGFENAIGTKLADTLTGSVGDNVLQPGAGDDKVDGAGNTAAIGDCVDYEDATAAVTVDLTAGTAKGGSGNDTLSHIEDAQGSDFNDTLSGDDTPNQLFGGGGNDTIAGMGDDTTVVGDFLEGDAGIDTVDYSWSADDTVTVTLADSTCTAAVAGSTVYHGTSGFANDGLDTIENAILTPGDDTFTGNQFSNTVWPFGGQNSLRGDNGGTGCAQSGGDTLNYSQGYDAGVTVNMAGGGTAGDSAVSFENGIGTKFADNFTGNDVSNTINGQGGNDTIRGGGGDDTLKGAKGNDTVRGGAGDDDMFGGKGKKDAGYGGGGTDLCKGFEIRKGCELH